MLASLWALAPPPPPAPPLHIKGAPARHEVQCLSSRRGQGPCTPLPPCAEDVSAVGGRAVLSQRTPPPPRVTFRRVVVPLRGPGQSPVLRFACCVGSLCSVGRCGRCSRWCRFRVRRAQWLVCRGCAGCGGMCRLRVSAPPPPFPTGHHSTPPGAGGGGGGHAGPGSSPHCNWLRACHHHRSSLPIVPGDTLNARSVRVLCVLCSVGWGRGAPGGKGPQRRPHQRLGRRLEAVAEAVGGGYCRLQNAIEPGTGRDGGRGGPGPKNSCTTNGPTRFCPL